VQFWLCMGVQPEWIDLVARFDPQWVAGRLVVRESSRDGQSSDEDLAKCLLYLYKFKSYSESRWMTLGTSLRLFVAARAAGLDGLVQNVREDPKSSGYYIGGYSKLTEGLRYYTVVAAILGYVPEAFLLEVLEDDRIAMRPKVYKDIVVEEIRYIDSIADFTWGRLARLVSPTTTGTEIRTKVLQGAWVALGFLDQRVFRVVRDYPWKLVVGDIQNNLEELAELEDPPEEPVARKVHGLLRLGL
jgi:hypothetical protein